MRILIVANNKSGRFSPFVTEQVASIQQLGATFEYFGIAGKGVMGYLQCLPALRRKIKQYKPDLIHAHYGLSGLLANLQRQVPVVTTYHGSDIHTKGIILLLSKIAMKLSTYNIFVARSLYDIAQYKRSNSSIISCGIDMSTIKEVDKLDARRMMRLDFTKTYVLFSGSFDNHIKNSQLALSSINLLDNIELIELKGYNREQVNYLLNACDLQLTTSLRESGPLVVKEAMACNRPIVSTDVGDVRLVLGDTEGCYICSYDPQDCANKIKQAIDFSQNQGSTNGGKRIDELGLDNHVVAQKIMGIYKQLIDKN